jgi:hypothetical protein
MNRISGFKEVERVLYNQKSGGGGINISVKREKDYGYLFIASYAN